MKRWEVNENVPTQEFREFELAFPLLQDVYVKKHLRLFADGHLELGVKKSPFEVEYKTEVHQ
jgi:hypothetical protein